MSAGVRFTAGDGVLYGRRRGGERGPDSKRKAARRVQFEEVCTNTQLGVLSTMHVSLLLLRVTAFLLYKA